MAAGPSVANRTMATLPPASSLSLANRDGGGPLPCQIWMAATATPIPCLWWPRCILSRRRGLLHQAAVVAQPGHGHAVVNRCSRASAQPQNNVCLAQLAGRPSAATVTIPGWMDATAEPDLHRSEWLQAVVARGCGLWGSSIYLNPNCRLMAMEGPVLCRPAMQAKLLAAALVNNSLTKSRQLGTALFGAISKYRNISRFISPIPQPCTKNIGPCCTFGSSNGSGYMVGNFSESDEDYVNSTVLEADILESITEAGKGLGRSGSPFPKLG